MKTYHIGIRWAECVFLGMGLMLLAVCGGAWAYRMNYSRVGIERFEMSQVRRPDASSMVPSSNPQFDFLLWSVKRVRAYEESLKTKVDRPLAVLRIPKIHLEVPVYNASDDVTLDRGVGRILGTAQVGEAGNLGIAGHRDGFFRGLKDLAPDDEIELDSTGRSDLYAVEKIQIVSPEDVSVLSPTRVPSLTLVTCFPFYYVGSAPKRYIVRAFLIGFDKSHRDVGSNPHS